MLQPCPSCSRHVRADDTRCPFCDAPCAPAAAPAAEAPPGLSRAALVAFAALATAGCRDAYAQHRPAHDGGHARDASADGAHAGGLGALGHGGATMGTIYGGPPTDAGAMPRVDVGPVVAVHPNDAALDATAARRTLRSGLGRVRACYETHARADAALPPTLDVRLVVDTHGTAAHAPHVTSPGHEEPELTACVTHAIQSLVFPVPHAATTINTTFTLGAR